MPHAFTFRQGHDSPYAIAGKEAPEGRRANPREMDPDTGKRAAAEAAVQACVKAEMTIGLGTGTTAHWAIVAVGKRVAHGERIRAVATSLETERLCTEQGIPLLPFDEVAELDVAIDGADEATATFHALKGGGGALFRERAVALVARSFALIVTEKKMVERLGAFPLPIEAVPFAAGYVLREIRSLGVDAKLRAGAQTPFITDNGNHIIDCAFGSIDHPAELDRRLRMIHGVVTTGLFVDLVDRIFIGDEQGRTRELQR